MNILYIISAGLILLYIIGQIHRSKRAEKRVVRVISNNCTGCKRCVKKCRRKALDIVNEETRLHAVVNPGKCTACRDCIAVCKFNALEIVERKQTK